MGLGQLKYSLLVFHKNHLQKKNLVEAFAGAETLLIVHESRIFGFIIGGSEKKSPPFPAALNGSLTASLASI